MKYSKYICIAILLFSISYSAAQVSVRLLTPTLFELIDARAPLNTQWGVHQNLRYWWTVVPWLWGGSTWYDLASLTGSPAVLTNMDSSNGWKSDTQGWFAGGIVFDGTDDYVTTTGLLGTPAIITVSVVVSTTSGASGTANQFFGIGDYVGIDLTSADQIEVYYYAGGSTWNSRFVSWGKNSTGWHQIVYVQVTGSTGNQTTYVDGVQVDQLTGVFSAIVYSGQGTDTYFGRHGNASSRFLHGSIADIRVWDRELSASEVWQVYQDILDRGRMAFQRRLPQSLLNVSGGIPPGYLH